MARENILIYVAIFFTLLTLIKGDQPFQCPNNGLPKLADDGKPIQCLPGQATSHIVCGRGYSCYFSGFNYQCCPTADEDDEEHDEPHHECPAESFTVLSSNGAPLKCNPRTKRCPEATMFCSESLESAICCERIDESKSAPSTKLETLQKSENVAPVHEEEHITTIINRDIINENECPNGLLLLSDDGKAVTCDKDGKCPQDDMFCHVHPIQGISVCCQIVEGEALEGVTHNPLKYNPEDAKKLIEELKIQKERENKRKDAEIVTSVESSQSPTTLSPSSSAVPKNLRYADNDARVGEKLKNPAELQNVKINVKAHAIKTHVDTNDDHNHEGIVYKPHNQGGYAVSRKLDKLNARKQEIDHKLLAQRFLLEQIKNGWPYDEKFYRTESVAVLHRGNRPAAIVHFPNRA